MARPLEALQAEILTLSSADRVRLLEHLLASLDRDEDSERAWDAVAATRLEQLRSGVVQPVPLADVIRRLEARSPERKSRSIQGPN